MAVPLLARDVKNVLRPLWLLAPSNPAPSYKWANVCVKVLALNPDFIDFCVAKNG